MGGLSAEELVFDERTTGAADDIERATRLARAMVTEYGMSAELGPQRLVITDEDAARGRDHASGNVSSDVAARVDAEVKRLIDSAHHTAVDLLTTHRTTLDRLAARLIEIETLDETELRAIFSGVAL